jgi:glutathione S-transferase
VLPGEASRNPDVSRPLLRILGKPTSINVRKVLWTCRELGLDYTLEPWGSGLRSTDDPEFLALNPNALVPVIEDDGFVLWESNAICRYLAAREGRVDLLPDGPEESARVEQWMDWQATQLNDSWRYAFSALVRRRSECQDPSAIAAGIAGWNRHMALLEQQLRGTGAYVLGPRFTLADVVLGLATHRWFMTPMDRPLLPAVAAYYDRLACRAGFAEHGRNGVP